ncbi:MAG: hypothetical protein HKN71_07930, partial [Gemmatimonadetes bacterium]|nr:hypothetical protein [Gemmatimonadota bacterium]
QMLIIAESSDHVVTPRTGMTFAEHLGDKATPILFETGCGHGLPSCEMFRVGALIRDFLRHEP